MADERARSLGYMTLSAIGVILGSAIDAMRRADVPEHIVENYLQDLEEGFDAVLYGEARSIMSAMLHAVKKIGADNDD